MQRGCLADRGLGHLKCSLRTPSVHHDTTFFSTDVSTEEFSPWCPVQMDQPAARAHLPGTWVCALFAVLPYNGVNLFRYDDLLVHGYASSPRIAHT